MKMNRVLLLSTGVIMSGFMLQGCDKIVHEPSHLSTQKIQVQEESFFEDVRVQQMDSAYVAALAGHYSRQGDGGVDLSVTYDPKSTKNTAMHAGQEVARISEAFRRNGVRDVSSTIIPVHGAGDESRALVSYSAFSAKAPDDCTDMPGYSDRNLDTDADYKLGCTRDSLFVKQIARTKDLQGRDEANATSDGRRAANIVDGYRTGVPNEALEGESASE